MSTFELFASTILLCLIIGALIGATLINLLRVEPLHRQRHADRLRLRRTQVRAETRPHLGTPYIRREPAVEVLLDSLTADWWLDNAQWSRKQDDDLATVTPLRVQTGRPV